MKIGGFEIPVETSITMPEDKIVIVSSPEPGDVPLIDAKDFQITSEHKDGKLIVKATCKARVNYTELEKRIEDGRLIVLKGINNEAH